MPKKVNINRVWISIYRVKLCNETSIHLKVEVNKSSGLNHKQM